MCLLAAICGMSSCHEKDDGSPDDGGTNYPVTTQLGQRTCVGTIVTLFDLPTRTSPIAPDLMLGLETDTESYILSYNGHWESEDKITIDGTEYAVGDRVEITGMASSTRISDTQEYLQLEILTIAKTSPVTTVLGQRTCEGTIVSLPNPPTGTSEPPLPGMVLGLETDTESYILSYNGHWESEDKITIDGTEYAVGDRVEITGMASSTRISDTQEYLQLEILTIAKTSPVTTVLGQRTCEGTIVSLPNPPTGTSEPPLPGMVLGLETDTESYILSYNGHWESEDKITIDGTEYAVGDRVVVTGTASETVISPADKYLELEIATIQKRSAGQ